MRLLRQRLVVVLSVLAALLVFGTTGYSVIEDWRIIDALYMSVITVSTVGFGEVRPLSDAGHLFSILLISMSIGTVGVSVGYLTQAVVAGEIRRTFGRQRLLKKIGKLANHYIVCGYGRCGSVVCDELAKQGIEFVVVENDKELIANLEEKELQFIEGDATDDEVLEQAGVKRAKGLVTSVSSDAGNVFIILSAKEINPDLFIVARAIDGTSESKLRRAGANRVVMPYLLGGKRMANAIVRPDVVDLIDFAFLDPTRNILVEQFVVTDSSPIVNRSLMETQLRKKYGLVVIGIKRPDGQLVFNPEAGEVIREGDLLILMGDVTNLGHLRGEANLSV